MKEVMSAAGGAMTQTFMAPNFRASSVLIGAGPFSLVNYPHFPLSFSGTPALLWPRPTVGFSLQTLVVVNLVNSSISTLLSDGNCCYRTIGICFRHIFETNTFLLALYLRGILFFSSHSSE
jgi:hypothetical protein